MSEKPPSKPKKNAKVIPLRKLDGVTFDDEFESDDEFFAERSQRKAKDASSGPVIQSFNKEGQTSTRSIEAITNTLALLEGQLRYEMEQDELNGLVDYELFDRRVRVLGKLSDNILRRRAAEAKHSIDLSSPQFAKILDSIIDCVRVALEKSGFAAVKIEDVMTHLGDEMEGWEERMKHELGRT